MKLLTNRSGSYLTGDDIADAVMSYGLALARMRRVDQVDIPFVADDRVVRRVKLVIGWLSQLTVTSRGGDGDELLEVDTILALYAKAGATGVVHAEPFTEEELRRRPWPNFD
jgi:hypothetical protein